MVDDIVLCVEIVGRAYVFEEIVGVLDSLSGCLFALSLLCCCLIVIAECSSSRSD